MDYLDTSLENTIANEHKRLRKITGDSLVRVSIGLCDQEGQLHTHAESNIDIDFTFSFHNKRISDIPNLEYIAMNDSYRIVNDYRLVDSEVCRHFAKSSLLSSLVFPITFNYKVIGFIFFNSTEVGFFKQHVSFEACKASASLLTHKVNSYYTHIENAWLLAKALTASLAMKYDDIRTQEDKIKDIVKYLCVTHQAYLQINNKFLFDLIEFSVIHDIGKLSVPDAILFKPEKLSPNEFEVMKKHPRAGLTLLEYIFSQTDIEESCKEMMRNITLYHHEKINGSGYPEGLSGDKIPIEAQIVAVADIYEALSSKRIYKDAWPREKVMQILKVMADRDEIDPVLVESMKFYKPTHS